MIKIGDKVIHIDPAFGGREYIVEKVSESHAWIVYGESNPIPVLRENLIPMYKDGEQMEFSFRN